MDANRGDQTTRPVFSAGAEAAQDCAVEVVDSAGVLSADALSWLVNMSKQAARQVRLADVTHGKDGTPGASGEVRVRIVDDTEMAAAHLEYSDIPGTTDVLTFDLGSAGHTLDLDILVCRDEAARQAAMRGHSLERELLLYILHGMLHGLGYDDHDDDDYTRMHAEEDRVLIAIGVGATFAVGGRQ